MVRYSRLSRRATLAVVLGVTTVSAAGAATFHRFDTTQTTGSEGAVATLQTSATGSAIQGQVNGSVNTAVKYPFGVLGEYNAAGSTFGIGVIGLSTTGYAVGGESLGSQPAVIADAAGTGIGLEALTQSSSSSPAIYAQSNGQGDGIDAAATTPHSTAGVLGEDLNNPGTYTDGVLGTTISGGYGIEGTSSDNALGGVRGLATTGVGVEGDSAGDNAILGKNDGAGTGVAGVNTVTSGTLTSATSDLGVYAESTVGNALYATSMSGIGVSAFSTNFDGLFAYSVNNLGADIESYGDGSGSNQVLELDSDNGGLLMTGYSLTGCGAENGGYGHCMQLDSNGNFAVNGSIMDKNGTFSRTRNPNSDLVSYGAQVTEPTMEDVGRAELVNGSASVPLAADYRQTIDNPNYLVFLTPHGDSKGLYVASESATGFVVRESQGGRSTLAFDYRIVAQQYGAHEGRLPHYATLHPNEATNRLSPMANRFRERSSADVAARARMAMLTVKKQQALKEAHDRPRFVPPPVHLPLVASFSNH